VSNGAVIIPFRIEAVAPGKSLDYFIGSVHWLAAMTPPMEKHLDDLARTGHKLLPLQVNDPILRFAASLRCARAGTMMGRPNGAAASNPL
jgi:hypothetical protein